MFLLQSSGSAVRLLACRPSCQSCEWWAYNQSFPTSHYIGLIDPFVAKWCHFRFDKLFDSWNLVSVTWKIILKSESENHMENKIEK